MDGFFNSVAQVAVAIVGVAMVAVIVSNRAKTAAIIQSAGDAFAGAIDSAVRPVSGSYGI